MKEKHVLFDDIDHVIYEEVEVERPVVKANEVRIETQYYGICGSDIHVLHGKHPFAKPPVVPGHEIAAIVTEVGSAVTNVKVGDHVTIDPIMACMHCKACLQGRFNLCEPPHVAGFRAPGLARSSSVIPARNCHVASPELPMNILVFAEPAACAHHCVHRMPQHCLEDVLVIGAGTIGLSIIQALKIIGAQHITAVEPNAGKRVIAEKLGADEVFDVGELPTNRMFDGVIDVVSAQATITQSLTQVRAGGTVICMGVPTGPREVPLPSMNRFERDLLSSGMYVPADIDGAVKWLEKGLFDTSDLITSVFPVEEATEAFVKAQNPNSIKTIIKF